MKMEVKHYMFSRDECFNCGDTNVTGFAGKQELPLCTECWMKLLKKELTLDDLEKKLHEQEG